MTASGTMLAADTLEYVPDELRNTNQWVGWRWKHTERGWTKVPVDPHTNFKASSTNQKTWSSLEKALDLYETHREAEEEDNRVAGVGFVFSEDDPYCGVDFDHCLDPETGEFTDKEVAEWCAELRSYTEVSPSGSGIHIIVCGELPGPRNKSGNREMYDCGRFFTMTGEHLEGTPKSLRTTQKGLQALYQDTFGGPTKDHLPDGDGCGELRSPQLSDEEVLQAVRNSQQAGKFQRLWDGDTSEYEKEDNEGKSEADLALVSILAFYTQDGEQLARLVKESSLYREKWEREDYRELTITKALSNMSEFYRDEQTDRTVGKAYSKGGVRTVRSNLERNLQAISFTGSGRPPPLEWVVADYVPAAYPTLLYGEGGKAKSLLGLHLGFSVAAKGVTSWLEKEVLTAPALYLDFELDQEVQARRVYDLAAGMGWAEPPTDLLYLGALGVSTEEAFSTALEVCEEREVRLVIVDSFGPAMEGDAESAADVLGFYSKYLDPLRAVGVAPVVIDHQSKMGKGDNYKNKTAFGSVYKTNLSRSVVQIDGAWNANVLTATLRHHKTNFGRPQPDLGAKLTFGHECVTVERMFEGLGEVVNKEAPSKEAVVRKALEEHGPMYPEDIADTTGLPKQQVKNAVSSLRTDGEIEDTGNKRVNAREVQLIGPYRNAPPLRDGRITVRSDETDENTKKSYTYQDYDQTEAVSPNSPQRENKEEKGNEPLEAFGGEGRDNA